MIMNIEKLAFETLKQLQTGILICDNGSQVLFLNQKMKEIAGLSSDDDIPTLGILLKNFLSGDSLILQIQASIEMVLNQKKESERLTFDISTGSSCSLNISLLLKNIKSNNDYVLLIFQVTPSQDELVREFRIAKEKARELARLRTYFLTNYSYELRTSLNSILGYSQLLEDELYESLTPEQQYYFASLQWGSTHLYDTVTRVHDISRIDSGEFAIHPAKLSLSKVLNETAFLMQQLAAAKNIELRLETVPEDISIVADATCLSSALTNLLDNAIKYTDEGTITIHVQVQPQQNNVQCRITDTGIGIDPEILPFLFEPFQHGASKASASYDTSGLGLALAKRYIELMNGTVEVESMQSKGTTFIITLQLADEFTTVLDTVPVRSKHHPEVKSRAAGINPLPKILLVEDQEDAQMLVKTFLRNCYEVFVAGEAEKALDILAKENPVCILMDVALQTPTGGLDFTLELRLNPDYCFIPIIALTAYALPGDRERFIGSGMNDYLSKPYRKSDLLNLLEKWVPKSTDS